MDRLLSPQRLQHYSAHSHPGNTLDSVLFLQNVLDQHKPQLKTRPTATGYTGNRPGTTKSQFMVLTHLVKEGVFISAFYSEGPTTIVTELSRDDYLRIINSVAGRNQFTPVMAYLTTC